MTEQMVAVGRFTGECGENSRATSQEGLQVGQKVELNGSMDLSSCIIGNDGACVYSITLTGKGGDASQAVYDYEISVDGQGPKGARSGKFHLAFTDMTGDTYKLDLYSSSRGLHTVKYNSKSPAILLIQWSNNSI